MLYPSIQELLKLSSDENGNERLNKYTLVMATAKCARIITNESRMRKDAEKSSNEKRDYKDYKDNKKECKDEKAVRSAVRELYNGEYQVLFEGDEGYGDSVVDVRALDAKLEEELLAIEEQEKLEKKKALEQEKLSGMNDEDEDFFDDEDDVDTSDLMNASEVYTDASGFSESDEDPGVIS